jgi:hypothetical protein
VPDAMSRHARSRAGGPFQRLGARPSGARRFPCLWTISEAVQVRGATFHEFYEFFTWSHLYPTPGGDGRGMLAKENVRQLD